MRQTRRWMLLSSVALLAAVGLACEPDTASSGAHASGDSGPPPDDAGAAQRDAREQEADASVATGPAASRGEGLEVALTGLVMTAPTGWVRRDVKPGPMAAKRAFQLPKAGADAEDGGVRITHFPGMKGMNEANLARWLRQVQQPDGTPSTRDDATIVEEDVGDVHLMIVDISGAVQATMRERPRPNARMIAAIIDHKKGPHFVVATGGAETIKKWQDDIYAFLRSAEAR